MLDIRQDGPVACVTLNRPAVRNAFHPGMIDALAAWARDATSGGVRVAVLAGAGPVFSAGADVDWMSRMVKATEAENLEDARRAAAMFDALDTLPFPLIGRVHGAALGGGAGLASVCDLVVAAEDALFGFTEVRLGILPAVIAPYALGRIGRAAARELFLTGARFTAARAREIGLVSRVVPEAELDATVAACVRDCLAGGPAAVAAAKGLIARIAGRPPAEVADLTTATMARHRVSPEGQEGLRAFLEKRPPVWMK